MTIHAEAVCRALDEFAEDREHLSAADTLARASILASVVARLRPDDRAAVRAHMERQEAIAALLEASEAGEA